MTYPLCRVVVEEGKTPKKSPKNGHFKNYKFEKLPTLKTIHYPKK
jgi:hypothetical protein